MIKHGSGDRHRQPATHLANPRAALFGVHRGYRAKQRQTNPPDLDAEMITRLPVATAKDHHNLFMAIDGVVGGMQDADAPLLAGSIGGIRRGLADHTVKDDPGAGLMKTVMKDMVSRTVTKVDCHNSSCSKASLPTRCASSRSRTAARSRRAAPRPSCGPSWT
jgi:hypothetical protein